MKKDNKNKRRKYAKNADINLENIPSSRRKMEYFKRKRAQNRLRHTIVRTHTWLKILSIVFLLWICSRLLISSFWYLPNNIFDSYPNKNLRIIGNKITPNARIIQALKKNSLPEKPLYLIDTVPYEKEVEKLSPVRKAFVRRYWLPARFEVTIEEEIPVLTFAPTPNAPEVAAITLEGKIITKEYLPIKSANIKTFKILTYDDYKKWSKKEILSLKILAERIEDYSQEKLLYLDLRNKNDVFAQLETIKIRIGELNSTLKERVERLTSIMPQIENLKKETDYVDIRWDNTTYLKKKAKTTINKKVEPAIRNEISPKKTNVTEKKSIPKIKNKKHEQPKVEVKQSVNKENKQEVKPPELEELKIQTLEP